MMRHRKIEELLAVYRSLDAGQRQLVDAHLQTCPSCAARLAAYEDMDRALFALPTPAPDPRMRSLTLDTLAIHADKTSPDRRNRQLAPRVFPVVVAVALVLVLGITAVFMVRGFVRTPSVQPKVVQPVLLETPTPGLTPAVVQTAEVSANVVPAEIQAVVDEVLRHTIGSTGTGAAQTDFAATIRRFRQADDWAVVDVSYKYGYDEVTSSDLLARHLIALQQTPDGVWRPSELVYMPELTLRTLWGSQKTLNLRHLDLVYYEFDEPFVFNAVADNDLDAYAERIAGDLQAPLETGGHLVLIIAPDRSALWAEDALTQVDGLSDIPLGNLVVPEPTPSFGIPPTLVPLPLITESSPVFGSSDSDVGQDIVYRLQLAMFHELMRRVVGDSAQSLKDWPAFAAQLAIWETTNPIFARFRQSPRSWLVSASERRIYLSELLDPGATVGDFLTLGNQPWVKQQVFSAYLEERYGKQSFGPLVRALFSEKSWEDVVRIAFAEDPVEFEELWQQWLATEITSVTPYPSSVLSATLTPAAVPGIVERDMATAAALTPLPSVTYSPAFATQEAAYAEVLATQTAQALPTPSPTATATPLFQTPPPDPRSLSGLVYQTTDGLWLIGADGKANFLSNQPHGALSVGATQMVTSEDGDIWLADLTTGERRNLTEQQDGVAIVPQWWPARPDAVIFGSHRSGDYASFGFLTAVGTDGRGYQLLDGQEGSLEKPALGRDGQTIAYDRAGKPYLYRWGAGPEPIDLSRFSGTDLAGLRMANPAWSPDGNKLAWFVYGELDQGNTVALAVLDLARQEARLLHPYLVQPMGGFPPAATWSPDGQWVAFSAYDQDLSRSGVWVVRADGSQERFLGAGSQPVWHPDGNRLAFSRFDAASGSRIVIADAVTWAVAELAEPKDGNVADWIHLDQAQ